MGTRTLNKGTQTITITNLTSYRMALSNIVLKPGEARSDISAADWTGNSDRAAELAELVAAGSILVTLNTNLTTAELQSLDGAEIIQPPPPTSTTAGLPDVGDVPVGYITFNTDEDALNVSTGTDWRGVTTAPVLTDGLRPAATAVPAGYIILNTTDGTLNVSDGTNWIDVTTGLIT